MSATPVGSHETRIRTILETFSPAFNAAPPYHLLLTIDAIEICGAEASIENDHAPLEKWFRDIKVYDIFEGTGQIQRIVTSKRLMTNLKSF